MLKKISLQHWLSQRAYLLAASMLLTCIVNAGQVQEVEIDGLLYSLNFQREGEGYIGATATVIGSKDTYPNIPKFIEYEGIKYRVFGIDDFKFNNYPYTPILGATISKNMDNYSCRNAINLQHIFFENGTNEPYAPYLPSTLKEFYSAPDWTYIDFTGSNLYNLEKIVFPILNSSIANYFNSYDPYAYGAPVQDYDLTEIVLSPVLQSIETCFNVNSKEKICKVVCPAPEPPTVDSSFEGWYDENGNIKGILHVPVGHANKYEQSEFWSNFEAIYDDVDFAGNQVDLYTEVNGLLYGLYPDGNAKVIGPVDQSTDYVSIDGQVYFPSYGYCKVTEIADCAFINCNNLLNVYYPYSMYKVGNFAFYNFNRGYGDNSINVATAEIIGDYAYAGTKVNLVFPDNIKYIGYRAFSNSLSPLREWMGGISFDYNALVLPEGLVEIEDEAFSGYDGHIVIPSTVKKLGENIVSYSGFATNISPVFYNSEMTVFPYCAFSSIRGERLEIPSSVEYIDAHVGAGYKNIVINENVRSIQPFAFNSSQETITCLATDVPKAWEESFGWENGESSAKKMTLHVRKGLKSAYGSVTGWNQFAEIIDDIDTEDYEFQGLVFCIDKTNSEATVVGQTEDNKNVVIPEFVEYKGVNYPVKTIAKWSLYIDNSNNDKIILPSTIEKIDDFAIYHDKNTTITSITCNASNPPVIDSQFAFTWPPIYSSSGGTLYVPAESVDDYRKANYWSSLFKISTMKESGADFVESNDDIDNPVVGRYYIDGRFIDTPHPGVLYIEKRKDGTSVLKQAPVIQ